MGHGSIAADRKSKQEWTRGLIREKGNQRERARMTMVAKKEGRKEGKKAYAWLSRKSVAAVEKARPDHTDRKREEKERSIHNGGNDEARIPATTTDGRVRN